MGSYRSAAAQATAGQAVLSHEDRPAGVAEADWLAPGEWIRYWAVMPHGKAADIAEAATVAVLDTSRAERRSRGTMGVRAEYKAGRAAIATFVAGLVDWSLQDETGTTVPFPLISFDDPNWFIKGKTVMSALPGAVVDRLQQVIDSGAEPRLDEPAADAEHEEDTEGNG